MQPSREAKYAIGTSIPGDERRSYLRESFAGYDRNRDGFITCDELMDVWNKCLHICDENVRAERVESEVKRFMAALDKDNNGRISFEEYVDYFENLWTRKEERNRKLSPKQNQPNEGTQATAPSDRSDGASTSRAQPMELFRTNAKET